MSELLTPEKSKRPELKFAKNFNRINYPANITMDYSLDFAGIYNTPGADKAYSHQGEMAWIGDTYQDFKELMRPTQNAERMRLKRIDIIQHLKEVGVNDYCMFESGYQIEFYFRNNDDLLLAAAGLMPEQAFAFDFISYPREVPVDYIEKAAKGLQQEFNEMGLEKAGLKQPVELKPDPSDHSIRAVVGNGKDLVTMFRHSKLFEAATYG